MGAPSLPHRAISAPGGRPRAPGDAPHPGTLSLPANGAPSHAAPAPSPAPAARTPELLRVLGALPSAIFVMAAAHEGKRGLLLVTRVMRCADEPPAIGVAVPKGQRLATLIRDSHSFALSLISPTQRLLLKRLRDADRVGLGVGGIGEHVQPSENGPSTAGLHGALGPCWPLTAPDGDPFDTLSTRTLVTGSPVLAQSMGAIDCDVMRHFDLEADYEMYIGTVVGAACFNAARLDEQGAAMPGAGVEDALRQSLSALCAGRERGGSGHAADGNGGAAVPGRSAEGAGGNGHGHDARNGRGRRSAPAHAAEPMEVELDPDDELQ